MKNILLTGICILFVFIATAKDKNSKTIDKNANTATTVITGTIADENSGESLVGVEVSIKGTNIKTYTDFDGNFKFDNVKPGQYKLEASYISYNKQLHEVSTKQNNVLKIMLHTSN